MDTRLPSRPVDTDGGVRRFDPPRAVEVLHDGRWFAGQQDAWVRWPTGEWRASVRYTTGVGQTYMRSVTADRVRTVE